MSTTKKNAKNPEDLQSVLQALIAQGQKDGMIRAEELNAHLEKLDLSPEKIEQIYSLIFSFQRNLSNCHRSRPCVMFVSVGS